MYEFLKRYSWSVIQVIIYYVVGLLESFNNCFFLDIYRLLKISFRIFLFDIVYSRCLLGDTCCKRINLLSGQLVWQLLYENNGNIRVMRNFLPPNPFHREIKGVKLHNWNLIWVLLVLLLSFLVYCMANIISFVGETTFALIIHP